MFNLETAAGQTIKRLHKGEIKSEGAIIIETTNNEFYLIQGGSYSGFGGVDIEEIPKIPENFEYDHT